MSAKTDSAQRAYAFLQALAADLSTERISFPTFTGATLRFRRKTNGHTDVDVVRKRGPLHLVRQPPPESLAAGLRDRFLALLSP